MEISRKTIPYTPVTKRLSEMTVMIVSTAGAHLVSQDAFDTSGDSTYRVIPGDAQTAEFTVTHGAPVHDYNWEEPRKDVNTIFPLDRLREMAAAGQIGGLAEKHIS
ncbi:MAG: glycine/sarcosine/betaine reductase selenoprotein B family protein, partial [Firmicutes bacterium]|nr:glycine/sarcosine/betaine reductase selenoprotein B family protein [Bacillota bacterium]